MALSEKQIKDFKKIFKEEFGKELSDEEARESGEKLLRLVEIIYKPMTEKDFKKYSK